MVERWLGVGALLGSLAAFRCQAIVGIEDTTSAVETGAADSTAASGAGASASGGPGASGTGGATAAGGTAGAGGGCQSGAALWYFDSDGDGRGNPAVSSCAPDPQRGNWVRNADDCDDSNRFVYRGQTEYFAQGYPTAAGSFDYDCDGAEQKDPAVSRAPDCASIGDLLLCGGSGFDPMPGRQGTNLDPYCGSNFVRTCTKTDPVTCGSTVVVSHDQFYRCR